MKDLRTFRGATCALLAVVFAGSALSVAAAPPINYEGERIEMIVPFSPGGGADTYGRVVAPYLQKHLPGQPTILVRNVPGGGSVPGANQFEAQAKPNGYTAMTISSSTLFNAVLAKKKVHYKVSGWEPVLLSPQGTVVYVSARLGDVKSVKDFAKLKKHKLRFGGKTPTSSEMRMVLAMELLGVDVDYVWGVERGPARLAMERGELTIGYDTTSAYMKHVQPLVDKGKFYPLFTFGLRDAKGKFVRDPNFPDLPSFVEVYEMVHGKKPSGAAFSAFKTVFQMAIMCSKGIVLPRGTPQPIVDEWSKAVQGMLDDPQFQKTASDIIGKYPQFLGEDVRPVLKEASDFTPEGWAWLKKFMKAQLNVNL